MTTTQNRITKKVHNSYIVWFEESNQWVYFEKPAYYIYCLHIKNLPVNSICIKTQKKYKLKEELTAIFVTDLIERIKKLSNPGENSDQPDSGLKFTGTDPIQFHSTHTYKINNQLIKIWFQTPLLGYYIHPVFQFLEIKTTESDSYAEFEVFNYNQNFILRLRKETEKTWIFKEINGLKRKLFIEISNIIYNKEEKEWMTFLHASAVSNQNQTILFSSASGSGKSTLSALLYKNGYKMVSDDFVLLDASMKKAFPFPAAISIKETAFHLFPNESFADLHYQGLRNKSVQYLNPGVSGKDWYKAHKIKSVIFVNYNPQVAFKLSVIPVPEALKLFFEQATISGTYENSLRFINWFMKTECFTLEYSDNEQAIKEISNLFLN